MEHGPAEMYNKTKWVLQIRLVAVCADVIRARLKAGVAYTHVLRTRADVLLSSVPNLRALPRGAARDARGGPRGVLRDGARGREWQPRVRAAAVQGLHRGEAAAVASAGEEWRRWTAEEAL